MSEYFRPSSLLEVYGNMGIETEIGKIDLKINGTSIQKELTHLTDSYYPDNPDARKTGHTRSSRLLFLFGPRTLTDVLLPRADAILTAQKTPPDIKALDMKDWKTRLENFHNTIASAFINPFDTNEFIFFFDIPTLISFRKIATPEEFREQFKQIWIHERQHFVQEADTAQFTLRKRQENDNLATLTIIYALGLPILGGTAGAHTVEKLADATERSLQKKISRRGLLKGIGTAAGLIGGGAVSAATYGQVGYLLNYQLLPTYEREAENAERNTDYSLSDLRKIFSFQFS